MVVIKGGVVPDLMKHRSYAVLLLILSLLGALGLQSREVGANSAAQSSQSYTFAETGKTVAGKLLQYWSDHGGVALQGFPISEQMQERSDTDGKTYTTQYFERSVLELHPENAAPYDVLPSLLGVFRYNERYPNGAPNPVPSTAGDSRRFAETGKWLGGTFLDYWTRTGGLLQHGFPISDQFTEVSDLDDNPYTVQYFERAVFEYHPELPDPYRVLLSQLGTLRYRAKYQAQAATPELTSTVTAVPTPVKREYGLVGQGGLGEKLDHDLLRAQYEAGIQVRLVHLGWDVLQPSGPDGWDMGATRALQERIDAFVRLGDDVKLVLDLGVHYTPDWVAGIDPLVDQQGNIWDASSHDGGFNVYWSPTVRQHVAAYISRVFQNFDFHGRLWIVRVGVDGGELLYPNQRNEDQSYSFWAFDSHAQAKSPVPGWKPGQPSPNGEASKFYDWYVDNLVDTFNFFLGEIRHYYSGYVAPVTPGVGIDERTSAQLIRRNLVDNSLGRYGTGNYWQRIFALLPGADAGVINWCSSVGDRSGNDSSPNWWEWSSTRQMAYFAHQAGRDIYGENTGRNPYDTSGGADPRTTAQWIFQAIESYNYLGILWVAQEQMTDPNYTSLEQYRSLISSTR